jgi:hypothetical protein
MARKILISYSDRFLRNFAKLDSKSQQAIRQAIEQLTDVLDILVCGHTGSVQQNRFGRLQPIPTCVSHGSIAVLMSWWSGTAATMIALSKIHNRTGDRESPLLSRSVPFLLPLPSLMVLNTERPASTLLPQMIVDGSVDENPVPVPMS